MAQFGQQFGGFLGVERVIIRTRPKAKFGRTGNVFLAQKFAGASLSADARGDPRQAACEKITLHRMRAAVADRKP